MKLHIYIFEVYHEIIILSHIITNEFIRNYNK